MASAELPENGEPRLGAVARDISTAMIAETFSLAEG
jgi:hypothetical protein